MTQLSSDVMTGNALVRNDPAALKQILRERLQSRVEHTGRKAISGSVIIWKPSCIPFHVEYTIKLVSQGVCLTHLASVRVVKDLGVVSIRLSITYSILTQPRHSTLLRFSKRRDPPSPSDWYLL